VFAAASTTGVAWLVLGVSGLVTWVAALTSRPVVRGIVALPALLGAAPMCRGAGGMPGHVRFGARTGGAVVILGVLLLVTALFFADSVATLFRLFPMQVLGVILFFAGMELATSSAGGEATRDDRTVLVVTAGIALWNMGVAYLAGLVPYHALRRRLVRL